MSKVLEVSDKSKFWVKYVPVELEDVMDDFLTLEEAEAIEFLSGGVQKRNPEDNGECGGEGDDNYYFYCSKFTQINSSAIQELVADAVNAYANRKTGKITAQYHLDVGEEQNVMYSMDWEVKKRFIEVLQNKHRIKYTAGRVRSLDDIRKPKGSNKRKENRSRQQLISHVEGWIAKNIGLEDLKIQYQNTISVQEGTVRLARKLGLDVEDLIKRHESINPNHVYHVLDDDDKKYLRNWWKTVSDDVPKDDDD